MNPPVPTVCIAVVRKHWNHTSTFRELVRDPGNESHLKSGLENGLRFQNGLPGEKFIKVQAFPPMGIPDVGFEEKVPWSDSDQGIELGVRDAAARLLSRWKRFYTDRPLNIAL